MAQTIIPILFLALLPAAAASKEWISDCTGTSNTHPIWTQAPQLLSTVTNGSLYLSGNSTHNISVIHLYGSPYEMGFAHGSLLTNEIATLYVEFFKYLAAEIEANIQFLPKAIRDIIETKGVDGALDLVYNLTKPFSPPHFDEELHGLADGSGVPYDTVKRVHMFPELIRAACSMFGAWGPATKSSSLAGGLLQLRALDWGTDNPLRSVPAVIVYHPAVAGHAFAILSWKGFVGAMTGYSRYGGVSEKKWYEDAPMEVLPRGTPWHYLLRDVLQFDDSLPSALDRVVAAQKTASIFIGLGSATEMQFRAVEYGVGTANIFNDSTPFPGYAPTPAEHPAMPGLVYIDKHTQPSTHGCMAAVLQAHYGRMDVAAAVELVSVLQTGDIHLAVYDYVANKMYASVASAGTPVVNAYDNLFFEFDMTALFAQSHQ